MNPLYFITFGFCVDQTPDMVGCGAASLFEMRGHDVCSTVNHSFSLWRLYLGTACHEKTPP